MATRLRRGCICRPASSLTTRVRLRGIDAPELKAACPEELQLAEAAGAALRELLGEGEVTIYNIGPDKYNGRVVADVATRRTDNVSAALLAAGHVRSYRGGHRNALVRGLIVQTKKPRNGAAFASSRHSGARVKRANPESRDSGFIAVAMPRNDER